MAEARRGTRRPGKSDPIDAEAVALAALRYPDLPVAELDGPAREVKLLSDHRRDLVVQRTRIASQIRWFLHELDPDLVVPGRGLRRHSGSCVVHRQARRPHQCRRAALGVEPICRVLSEHGVPIAPSTYWDAIKVSRRVSEAELREEKLSWRSCGRRVSGWVAVSSHHHATVAPATSHWFSSPLMRTRGPLIWASWDPGTHLLSLSARRAKLDRAICPR